MGKKTPADWKKEAEALKGTLAAAKKKPQNFGLVELAEGMNLVAHPLHPVPKLAMQAKQADGAKKANCVTGHLEVSGKLIVFNCIEDKLPGGMDVKFKKYLQKVDHGAWKAQFNLAVPAPNGADGEAPQTDGDGAVKAKSTNGEAEKTDEIKKKDGELSKEKLGADLKHMTEVFKLSFKNMSEEDSKQLKQALKAIAGAIASGDLNGANNMMNKLTLLTGVDGSSPMQPIMWSSAPKKSAGAKSGGRGKEDDAKRKKELIKIYDSLKPKLRDAVAAAEGAEKAEIGTLVKEFDKNIKADKLDDATETLKKLKEKLDEEKGVFEQIGDFVEDVKEKVEEAYEEKVEEAKKDLEDFVEGVEDTLAAAAGVVTDFVTGERPLTEKEQKEFPKKLSSLKVPAKQQESLMKLAVSNRSAFDKTVEALEKMDAIGGGVEISPDAIEKSQTAIANAKQALDKANTALEAQEEKLTEAEDQEEAAKEAEKEAIKAQEAAQKALDDFQDALPDMDSMTPAQKKKAATQSTKLINALEDAKKLTEKAKAATTAATEKVATQQTAVDAANTKVGEAADAKSKAEETRKALDQKKGLLDALAFGPLSPNAKKPLDEASVAKFVDAFTKDPQTASTALEMASQVDDPKVLAENVGMVCDKVSDGFADKNGKKLDATPEEIRAMAENALKMGVRQGDEYFKGFDEYLKTGKQHEPDPCGGTDEFADLGDVAVKRSGMMAKAMLDENGKVDVTSDKAKNAMDHMLFHPGSLTTPSPAVTEEMQRVTKMFKDPTTGPQAQTVIDGVKKPTNGSAKTIVAQTMDKKPGELTDADSKQAVLSAMMSPMAQGPVGSCFTTAPARRLKQSQPLEAMKGMAEVATTGMFTPKSGSAVPILDTVPDGENPLMRAWEYAGATAAARVANSNESKQLNSALFGDESGADNLNAIKGVVGADAWGDKMDNTKTPPQLEPGIRSKLRTAMSSELKFIYDAAPKPEAGPGGGGGDGRSTDGGYAIFYKNKPVRSEEAFEKAVKEIALKTAGETEDSDKGKAIIAIIDDPKFKAAILGDDGYKPWELDDGGMEDQATKALIGGNPSRVDTLPEREDTDTDTRGERTRKILDGLLKNIGGKTDDLYPIGTAGDDANHAFNGLPNHPSFAKLKDPNSGDKIKAELLDPGKKIATDKMPVEQAAKLFDKQVSDIVSEWGNPDDKALKEALKKRPTKEMTPKELSNHVKKSVEKLRKAEAKNRAEAYVKKAIKDGMKYKGKPITKKDVGWIAKRFEKKLDAKAEADFDKMLMKEFKPPEVVVADSNWGGPDNQILFVIAPDPKTGDLRMFEKDAFSGEMTPIKDNWVDATWDRLEG